MLQVALAAFDEPVVATGLVQLGHQLIGHFEHVLHITLGVFLHVVRHGAQPPVGTLVLLAEHHAVVVLHQSRQAELLETQQARSNLRIENHMRQRAEGILQQAHVVVSPVHPHIGLLEPERKKAHILQSQGVDDDYALGIGILDETELLAVAVQAVGLQIQHSAPLRLSRSADFPLEQCFGIGNHERAACYHIAR